jgi:hypothetical protein
VFSWIPALAGMTYFAAININMRSHLLPVLDKTDELEGEKIWHYFGFWEE